MKKVNEVKANQSERAVEVEEWQGESGTICLKVGQSFCFGAGKASRLLGIDEEGVPVLLDVLEYLKDRGVEALGENATQEDKDEVADALHAKFQRAMLAYAQKCQEEGRDISDLLVQMMDSVAAETA